jgi:tetratricopeptide (TPR) repeat protein
MKSPKRSAPGRQAPPAPNHSWIWLGGLAIAALVLAVYYPTLNNGFISDDMFYVRENQKLASWGGLKDIWFKIGATPQYYPLVHTFLWMEYHAWDLDPRGYHAVGMVVHAANALLLWWLLKRLEVPGAWLGAALFAVHPVEVETVAWASEQKNLFGATFALGSILAFLSFRPAAERPAANRPWAIYALSIVLYMAALFCKTVTITTPAVLLVIYWWKLGRITRRELLPLAPFFVVGAALASITVWMERSVVGATGPQWNHTFVERLLIAGRAVWFYAGKLVWPYPLSFVYERWRIDASDWWQYLYPVAALALLIALWALRHRIGRGPLAAALIFGGVLMPALGFFDVYPFLFSFVADHYQYHASMAFLAAISAGGVLLAQRFPLQHTWLALVCATGIFTLLVVVAHSETYAYKDNESLIRHGMARCPQAWAVQFRYATLLSQERNYAGALEHYREALRLFPEHPAIHTSIGDTLASLGRSDDAIAEYHRALNAELHPIDRSAAHYRLANVLIKANRKADAIQQLRAAIQHDPEHTLAIHNLGILLMEQGDLAGAIEQFRAVIKIDPTAVASWQALAEGLEAHGQPREALTTLHSAVKLLPNDAGLHLQLGKLLLASGDHKQAERELRTSLRLEPTADAHNLLGVTLGAQGNLAAAIDQFQAALRIAPEHGGAAANLQNARAALKSP